MKKLLAIIVTVSTMLLGPLCVANASLSSAFAIIIEVPASPVAKEVLGPHGLQNGGARDAAHDVIFGDGTPGLGRGRGGEPEPSPDQD